MILNRLTVLRLVLAIIGIPFFLPTGIQAQSTKEGGQKAAQETPEMRAVRKGFEAFVEAFNKGDAKTIETLWTEGGKYVNNEGESLDGRVAILKAFVEYFKKETKRTLGIKSESVYFLSKNTAVEKGILMSKHSKLVRMVFTRYSALHVREGGKWKIALVREWEEIVPQAKLKSLAWLVGSWSAKTKDTELSMTFRWNKNKTFLYGEFSLKEEGKDLISGKQIIGRDPVEDVIRAWSFMSDGSYGHSVWTLEENRWVAESASRLVDGREASAVNIYAPLSEDAFSWQSIERNVGDEILPDTTPVKIQRVKK
ncbi:MAG: YybH family protein [Gemmataceae bacterium]